MIRLNPPGTWCAHQAIYEMLQRRSGNRFVEIGCGSGELSSFLLSSKRSSRFEGVGVDFSDSALAIAQTRLEKPIHEGRFRLLKKDFNHEDLDLDFQPDFALCMMVIEHVENDLDFFKRVVGLVKKGGHVLVGVPGRKEKWCIEDELVGHYRRYERSDLNHLMKEAGLEEREIWSIAVPTANLLFGLSNYLQRKQKNRLAQLPKKSQTQESGILEIPYKTVFPSPFRLLLNPLALSPLFVLQRLFYKTNLGLSFFGVGRKKA